MFRVKSASCSTVFVSGKSQVLLDYIQGRSIRNFLVIKLLIFSHPNFGRSKELSLLSSTHDVCFG